jgi:mRNA interferase MazF
VQYERGDVAYGADPFKGVDAARPWLIISTDTHPFHGDQYIATTLTTKTWYDQRISPDESDWIEGGTPEESSVVPWNISSIDHDDLDFWQGRLRSSVVDEAVDSHTRYL